MWEGLKEREGGEEGASSILSIASLQLSPLVLHLRKKKSQWVQSLDPPNHLHPSLSLYLLPRLLSPLFFPSFFPLSFLLLPSCLFCEYSTKTPERSTTSRKEPRAERARVKVMKGEMLKKQKQKYLPLLKFINYLVP